MIRAKGFFIDCQRALIERPGLCILALVSVQYRKIVQARGHFGTFRANRFFKYRQRTFEKRFGLCILTLGVIQQRKAIQTCSHVRVIRVQGLFGCLQRSLCHRGCTVIVSLLIERFHFFIEGIPFGNGMSLRAKRHENQNKRKTSQLHKRLCSRSIWIITNQCSYINKFH